MIKAYVIKYNDGTYNGGNDLIKAKFYSTITSAEKAAIKKDKKYTIKLVILQEVI